MQTNFLSFNDGFLKLRLPRYFASHDQGKGNKSTQQIIAPIARARIVKELARATKLLSSSCGEHVYLTRLSADSYILRELGRLRELSFRTVDEGTGRSYDTDRFDLIYQHIVLWDEGHQEIIGAYRIADTSEVPISDLYTQQLFEFGPKLSALLANTIELGRSFIQPRYWSRRGLDLLWKGIGVYISARPHVRYLLGAVSLTNSLPAMSKQEVVALYQHHFQPKNYRDFAAARRPFQLERSVLEKYRLGSYTDGSKGLNKQLRSRDLSLPPLFKHYAALCEKQGTNIIDFNIDPGFAFCIDALFLLDLHFMHAQKQRRYLPVNNEPMAIPF